MFNCAACLKSVGPKISPLRIITGTRAVSYHNEYYREDELGRKQLIKVDSLGEEITGEEKVCPDCAGVKPVVSSHIVIGGQSPREKEAPPMRVALVACAINSLLDTLDHGNKGAKQAASNTVPLIKGFVELNKEFVF